RLAFGIAFAAGNLGNAMSDVVDYIYTRHALLLEQEDRLALLLADNGHQHARPGDFTLARALHMEYRTLQNALEAQRRLGFPLFMELRDQRRDGIEELLQSRPQSDQKGATGAKHGGRRPPAQPGQPLLSIRHEFFEL